MQIYTELSTMQVSVTWNYKFSCDVITVTLPDLVSSAASMCADVDLCQLWRDPSLCSPLAALTCTTLLQLQAIWNRYIYLHCMRETLFWVRVPRGTHLPHSSTISQPSADTSKNPEVRGGNDPRVAACYAHFLPLYYHDAAVSAAATNWSLSMLMHVCGIT